MDTIAQFKLSKQGGLTRRLTFPTHPSWALLSSKINEAFGIATDNIGVSYLDQDGDEVTLSSEEELQDYYDTLGDAKHRLIRLSVQDLSSLRSTDVAPTRHHTAPPQQSHFRNTFGEQDSLPFIWEVDDEWQRLPGSLGSLFLSSDSPESPHAFVEVLESDVSVSKKSDKTDEESAIGDVTRSDRTFTMPTSRTDKGKSRVAMQPTVEDDASSTDSVCGDDAPLQPQAHVRDSDKASTFGGNIKSRVSVDGTVTPAQAQSTPVISGQVLPEAVLKSTEDPNAAITDDPALPTLGSTGASSLTHDVAAFLKTASGIISAHPELSEGLRSIVSNATNGTYWTAHRDALSRAAERIQQESGRTVEEIQNAEEEASARVAEALGGIFRVIGEAIQTARTTTEPLRSPAGQDVPTAPESAPEPPFHPREFVPYPGLPPPGHFPPHPRHHWVPPPPPPGHRHGWPRPPPPFWGLPGGRQEEGGSHGLRADHHNAIRARMSDIRTTLAEARNRRLGNAGPATPANPPPIPNAPPAPPASVVPPPPVLQDDSSIFKSTSLTQEELRADVERAKADYKMRKERYRQARASRKTAEQRERGQEPSGSNDVSGLTAVYDVTEPNVSGADTSVSQGPPAASPVHEHEQVTVPPSTAAPAPSHPGAPQVHIVSNARGMYPQLEMFSVPRRSHTIGHTARRGLEDRSRQRIMKKLSEMGFTEGTYPKLNARVSEQMAAHPPTTQDIEDDIVTNLIEELIPSTFTPRAGGSREPIPGAWA
ncbi:uncharacterized protein EDB93DRAFT_1326340 [Suillus bovinus]|uniref:uncharacterized protein n=1 Tax=Suillus bovinus TaxID=48563 RepID=UPI001B869917|nr:uncharacterized protein EDB93DRAFT_1326340 [Suillus bovinus]KAG2156626.1 hypothetical protein EDB93DRAFT_1326340 [Suillus bovinus]